MNQIRYFSLLGLFILLCYAAPASLWVDSLKGQTLFRVDYLRLEVSGDVTDRIYYKLLQHLNRSNTPGQLDNMPSSIDCLGVGFRITPTVSTFIGKQYADFGGFEYDANPAEVYEYSDLGNEITCFLVGANLCWWLTPTQEIRFQIVDGHSGKAKCLFSGFGSSLGTGKIQPVFRCDVFGRRYRQTGYYFRHYLPGRSTCACTTQRLSISGESYQLPYFPETQPVCQRDV